MDLHTDPDPSPAFHPAVAAYLASDGPRQMLAGYNHNLLQAPEAADLADLARLARSDNYAPPYQPDGRCRGRLRLRQAVRFGYSQEAYADHGFYVVPADIEAGADHAACEGNLRRFCAAVRTHTGWAGSGSTWSGSLVETPAGFVVVLNARHSISD